MPPVKEEPRAAGFDLERILGIVRRRHLQFLIPLFLGWAVVWGASWILPPRYESSTTILVSQPTIPQDYVQPNISDDWQTRLESIKQQILSQTRLLMIIDKLHLYQNAGASLTDDEKVDQMRKDIDVELDRDPSRMNISAFVISYSAGDPQLAQNVTGELSNLFISENQKVRQQQSEGTTQFLQQQLQDARSSLSAQDSKVQQFEAQHGGTLPTQEASNLQILAGLQTEMQNEQDALNAAKQQKTYMQAMLQQERTSAGRAEALRSGQGGGVGAPDLATVDAQIDRLRGQLADLSSRYTDQYPDVLVIKNQIAKMEVQRDSLIAAAKVKGSTAPSTPTKPVVADDPSLSGPAQQIAGQLQANELEITNRENAIAELKTRIGEYQGRLNSEPSTSQQLSDLTRGYDQSKANYDDLLKREQESQMATSMERLQQGETFTVLDPPTEPTKPTFPNRLKFCALGIAAGLAFGLIVAGGLEFLDDRMHSGKDIKALLPMTVISEVPAVETASDEHKKKRRLALGWATTVVIVALIVTGSIISLLNNG
jgi:polysaccharide chain length determinant protein (PEP-CTERM system associated)